MVTGMNEKTAKRGQKLYIVQASLEYMIALLVAGSFLATLTKELGFSDGLTGVLSSVISLGCVFQLFSIAIRPKRVKPLIVALSIGNQLLFSLLYVFPFINIGQTVRTVLFVVFIVAAYFLYNLIHPKKINWLMSTVEDANRGVFTANKEIVSLLLGIGFSYGMGELMDAFIAKGALKTAFVICGVVMVALMVLHSVVIGLVAEDTETALPSRSLQNGFLDLIKQKRVRQVTVLYVLYYVANYISTPFFGTYQITELGLSLGTVAVLGIVGNVARIVVSKPWGRYADKHSFAVMVEKCLFVLAAAKVCVAFAVPANGVVMFALYYLINGIAAGGINSALMNLVFDYVPHETRSDALAVTLSLSGVVGFVTTLCASPLIGVIQANGNRVLGIPMYAQQVVAAIGAVIVLIAAVYARVVFLSHKQDKKMEK